MGAAGNAFEISHISIMVVAFCSRPAVESCKISEPVVAEATGKSCDEYLSGSLIEFRAQTTKGTAISLSETVEQSTAQSLQALHPHAQTD